MHYHAELVFPRTEDVESSVKQVMEFFLPEPDEDGSPCDYADWWDYYTIGGRWSGEKLEARIAPDLLQRFQEELVARAVTVSGIQFGKQEISPADQIPMVDALWTEITGQPGPCPRFQHGRDQFGRSGIYSDDVCTVAEIPERLECYRLIIAKPHWDATKAEQGVIYPVWMLATQLWNGVTHQDTTFDSNVVKAIQEHNAAPRGNDPVGDDWLCVTVDYHN